MRQLADVDALIAELRVAVGSAQAARAYQAATGASRSPEFVNLFDEFQRLIPAVPAFPDPSCAESYDLLRHVCATITFAIGSWPDEMMDLFRTRLERGVAAWRECLHLPVRP